MPTTKTLMWSLMATLYAASAMQHKELLSPNLDDSEQDVSSGSLEQFEHLNRPSGNFLPELPNQLPFDATAGHQGISNSSTVAMERTVSGQPTKQLKVCLKHAWRQAIEDNDSDPKHEINDPLQSNQVWETCYAKAGLEVKTCELAELRLADGPLRSKQKGLFRRELTQNWCNLAVNHQFEWLGQLMEAAGPYTFYAQFTTIAYMVEYMSDRVAAAAVHRLRVQMYTVSGYKNRFPVPTGDKLLTMDTVLRYPALVKPLALPAHADISVALILHFYWRARAMAVKEPSKWKDHVLFRQAVPDSSSPQVIYEHFAQKLALLNDKAAGAFEHNVQDEQDQKMSSVYHYLEQGTLKEDVLAYDESELSYRKFATLSPFYLVAQYLDLAKAIEFYNAAHQKRKDLLTVVYAGASTAGTRLLEHVIADVFSSRSAPMPTIISFTHRLSFRDGMAVLPVLCALLHTDDSWTLFQTRFTVYIATHQLREHVVQFIREFIEKRKHPEGDGQQRAAVKKAIRRLREFHDE